MNRALLFRVSPKFGYCISRKLVQYLIANLKPNIQPPFTVYLYIDKPKNRLADSFFRHANGVFDCGFTTSCSPSDTLTVFDGKIAMEFICDQVEEFECSSYAHTALAEKTGLDEEEIRELCNGHDLCTLHITKLKVYDVPILLERFLPDCDCNCAHCRLMHEDDSPESTPYCHREPITSPPKSQWRYIEGRG